MTLGQQYVSLDLKTSYLRKINTKINEQMSIGNRDRQLFIYFIITVKGYLYNEASAIRIATQKSNILINCCIHTYIIAKLPHQATTQMEAKKKIRRKRSSDEFKDESSLEDAYPLVKSTVVTPPSFDPNNILNSQYSQTKKVKPNDGPAQKKLVALKKKDEQPATIVQVPPTAPSPPAPKRIHIPALNKHKIFSDILNQANKEAQYLIRLRNLLSGCNRTLEDKKILFRKKWAQLRNSNCSQADYHKREQELKKAEIEEDKEIKEDILIKLGYSNIKGFETKDELIRHHREQQPNSDLWELDQADYQRYKSDQLALLEMLMKEADLVSQEYNTNRILKHSNYDSYEKSKQMLMDEGGGTQMETEMDQKFNNLDSQENPQNVQFLFNKQFSNINYSKIFEGGMNIQENEKFHMSKKTTSWLLDSKIDQIYSNQTFQVETYDKYTRMLREIHAGGYNIENVPSHIIDNVLETATYILNSVHYYQKFKLKCPILHPVDIMYVLENIKSRRGHH